MAEQDSVVDRGEKNKTASASTKEDISKSECNTLWLEQKPIDKHLTISTTTTINHGSNNKGNHFGHEEFLLAPSSNHKTMDLKYNLLKPASCNDFSKSKFPVSNRVSECSLNNNNIQQHHVVENGCEKKKNKHQRDIHHHDGHEDLHTKDKKTSQVSDGCNNVKLKAHNSKNNVFSLKNFVKHHEISFDDSTPKSPKKKNKDVKSHTLDSHNNKITHHGPKRKSEVVSERTSIKKMKHHHHNHIKIQKKEHSLEKVFSPTEKGKKNQSYNQPILQFEKLPLIKKKITVEHVGERKEKHKKSHKSSSKIKGEKVSPLSLPTSPTKIIDKKGKCKILNIELHKTTEEHKINDQPSIGIYIILYYLF